MSLTLGVAALLMLGSYTRQALYPAPRVPVPSPAPEPLAEVVLPVAGGVEVVGWAWAPPAPPPGAPAVLFLHGNGENLETMRRAGLFAELRGLGVPFLAIDYPGYGRSGGRPSEEGLTAAGAAALAWLAARHPERPLVACGWSLGAAVAVALAASPEHRVAGLVALSPWSSLRDVARVHFFALGGFLVSERYDSVEAAARIRVPALLIHGRRDGIIPFRLGEKLAAALPAATTRFVPIPDAGHNDLLGHPMVWVELERFLRLGVHRAGRAMDGTPRD
ncbi:MAG TPA: alpha/beta hydrolase [Thermoanaerobaculia bacterium]|nr:alpha/beta hydrolase [Thermoanaerobaculia bacterium]